MNQKDVLLCLDAFGTLFRPRVPIYKQYAEVARKFGINGFDDEGLVASLSNALKEELKDHPNYGRATDMGSERWWTNVIEKTFGPFNPAKDKKLPAAIAPTLLHRFSSKEGYDIYPDAMKLFKNFSDQRPGQTFRRVDQHAQGMPARRLVVGLITNSDDRVPAVLSSFGLKVKPLRHGEDPRPFHPTNEAVDIDFAIMSYDVGHEKPDRRIFDSASNMLKEMLRAEGHKDADLAGWDKYYVGDELAKDAHGAFNAGWNAVLVERQDADAADAPKVDLGDETVSGRELDNGGKIKVIRNLVSVAHIIEGHS